MGRCFEAVHGYPALSVFIPTQWFDIYWAFIDPAHEGPGFQWGSCQTPWEVQLQSTP